MNPHLSKLPTQENEPMGLFDFLKPRKQKSAHDVLMENPLFRQQKALFDAMNQVCATGCAGDELPNGHGEFGLTPTNPIPTNTIMGSRYYLSQLCTADRQKKVDSKRRGHVTSEISPMPIDVYETFLPDGTRLPTIYISPYQQNNSRKAPRGFSLLFSKTN